jgi:ribonuclease Z
MYYFLSSSISMSPDTRFAVIAEIERQESQAWRGGKAIFAHHFVCRSIPAEPNEEDYAVMMELEVKEEVLEIEVGQC